MRSVYHSFYGSLRREVTEDLRRLYELAACPTTQYESVDDHTINHQHEIAERRRSPLSEREGEDDSTAQNEPSHEADTVPEAEWQAEQPQLLINTADAHDDYDIALVTTATEVDEVEHGQMPQRAIRNNRASVLLREQQSQTARRRKLAARAKVTARLERRMRIEEQGLTYGCNRLEGDRMDRQCPIPEHESLGEPVAHEVGYIQERAKEVLPRVVRPDHCQGAIGAIDQTGSDSPHIGDSSGEDSVASAILEVAQEPQTEKHGATSAEEQEAPVADVVHGQATEASKSTMNRGLATIGEQATERHEVASAETGIKPRVFQENTEVNSMRNEEKIFGRVEKEQGTEQVRRVPSRNAARRLTAMKIFLKD